MPNRALVMSGGGAKGAFEVGAVSHLVNEANLDFEVIAGVSTGSLNAIMLAQGSGLDGLKEQVEGLREVWLGIESDRDVYLKRFLGELLLFFSKPSLYRPKPLWKKIQERVDPERLKSSGKQLRIGAVGLESGAYKSIDQEDPQIREWTLASSSIPLVFPPVAVGGESAVDGGVRNVTPLQDAFRALKRLSDYDPDDPDEMYVVLASPLGVARESRDWKDGLSIGKRSLGIAVNEIYREDLTYALAINHSVQAYDRLTRKLEETMGADEAARLLEDLPFEFRPPKYRRVRMYGVIPEKAYMGDLEFDPAKIREAIDAGAEAAKSPLSEEEMRRLLS